LLEVRVTRSTLAKILVVAVSAAFAPIAASGIQEVPHLEGRWTLNRTLSQIPREVGFNVDWLPAGGAGTNTTTSGGGGRGRRGSGGGGGGTTGDPFRGRPQSADDASRVRQLTAEVRTPPVHLTIAEAQGGVTVTDDQGHARTFRPDGREAVLQLDAVPVGVMSKWDAGKLVVVYKVEPNHDLRYAYSSGTNPAQLIVEVEFIERGGGNKVRFVYEPASATETAAPPATRSSEAPAKPALSPTATPAAPSQPFNQQPDAELKGLNALGIVVEDLSAQAAACGLNKDTLESALSNRLSGAGLNVRRNSDEDTYLYVHVITTSLSNGLCVSRYDALLYTHTTATLSYQTKPVLVQVELMRKGSVAGGPPTRHGAAVLQALQDYVDQFAARIKNANK
jgi:hypothetical protein